MYATQDRLRRCHQAIGMFFADRAAIEFLPHRTNLIGLFVCMCDVQCCLIYYTLQFSVMLAICMSATDVVTATDADLLSADFVLTCSPGWMIPYVLLGATLFYLVGMIAWLGYRRWQLSAFSDVPYKQLYIAALDDHGRRSQLYLQLLTYLIVADPLQRNEKRRLHQQLQERLYSPPSHLNLAAVVGVGHSHAEMQSVERWADECWRTVVLEAEQTIPDDMWSMHSSLPCECQVAAASRTAAVPLECEDTSLLAGAAVHHSDHRIITAGLHLEEFSTIHDAWPRNVDLLSACGVHFLEAELRAQCVSSPSILGGEPDSFVSMVNRRLAAARVAMLSCPDMEGARIMLFAQRDMPHVERILAQLFPPETLADALQLEKKEEHRHFYGEYDFIAAGHSYHAPGKTIEDSDRIFAERKGQAHLPSPWTTRLSDLRFVVVWLLCFASVLLCIYPVPPRNSFLSAVRAFQVCVCLPGATLVALFLAGLFVHAVCFHELWKNMAGVSARERKLKTRGRPAHLSWPQQRGEP